jgi:hypothetical protein
MPSDEKVCPRCAETVKSAALVCRYCGYEFGTPVKGAAEAPHPAPLAPPRQRFWRGPIQDRSHANNIVLMAGIGFLILGGVPLLGLSSQQEPAAVVGKLLTSILFIGPSIILLWRKSRIAAWILLGICSLAIFLCVGMIPYLLLGPDPNQWLALSFVPLALFWLALSYAAYRACRAASFLSHSRTSGAAPVK